MYVCLCFGVTDKAIRAAVENNGVGNMRQLREQLGVGGQCGKCVAMAQQVIDETIICEELFKEVS